jgi:hypothetical protein
MVPCNEADSHMIDKLALSADCSPVPATLRGALAPGALRLTARNDTAPNDLNMQRR